MANTDQLLSELKKSLSKLATKGIITRLVSLSFFGRLFALPLIGWLASLLLGFVVKEVFEELEQLGYDFFIRYQKSEDAEEFTSAAEKNEEIQSDSEASAADKQKAEDELLDKARKLIRYN